MGSGRDKRKQRARRQTGDDGRGARRGPPAADRPVAPPEMPDGTPAINAMHAAAEHGGDHLPVMLGETLQALRPKPGDVAVDLTAGRGGHAAWLARSIAPGGTLLLADLDVQNLAFAADRAREFLPADRVIAFHGPFDAVPAELRRRDLLANVVLADLGFASNQMDDPDRGLSFSHDGPLDMRLDRTSGETAADVLRVMAEEDLARMIIDDGEEPLGRKIAGRIAVARDAEPILTTRQLAEIVVGAYGARAHSSRVHPATRTFMALRIAVNRELDALDGLLRQVASGALAAAGGTEPRSSADAPSSVDGYPAAGNPADRRSADPRPGGGTPGGSSGGSSGGSPGGSRGRPARRTDAPDQGRARHSADPGPSFLGRTPDTSTDPEASEVVAGRRVWLAPGARTGIISFHSLEDRAVKRAFRELGTRNLGEVLTRKPMIASEAEVRTNPRSRSAKLRVVAIRCVMD